MSEWTLSDVGLGGALSILGCVMSTALAIYFTIELRRRRYDGPPLTGQSVVATLGAYFFIGLCVWFFYSGVRGRHLLRVESRYTVATITRVRRVKAQWESRYIYTVGGMRYTDYLTRGSHPALPIGSRWWLRYAATDPAVHEWRYEQVPFHLVTVPDSGWLTPDKPPGYVPPPVDDPGAPRTATILEEDE